jgi:hypothetical protein
VGRVAELGSRRYYALGMPALKDEMVLNVDGFVPVDPALGLRERAQRFVASRQWATPSVYYGDQPEPADPQCPESTVAWSMCFCLGLDHVTKTRADWFADVAAIVEFVRAVALEAHCEFTAEFRLRSRLWYSETLDIIGDDPNEKVDLAGIRSMLAHFTEQRCSWWRVSDSAFQQTWPRERLRGRVRFIVTRGVFPWGLVAGLAFSALAGHGVTGLLPPLRVVIWFVIGIALGGCIGIWRWARSERRYKDLIAQHETAA